MKSKPSPDAAPQQLADVTAAIAALTSMTSRQLARRLTELTGQPSRTNNREYLIRAVATVLQERAEPFPKDRIARRVAELGDSVPLRWRMKASPVQVVVAPRSVGAELQAAERDPRLPPPGSRIRRHYKGVEHEVLVGEDSFHYKGRRFKSLSHVARVITTRQWNGFAFFGLTEDATVEAAS